MYLGDATVATGAVSGEGLVGEGGICPGMASLGCCGLCGAATAGETAFGVTADEGDLGAGMGLEGDTAWCCCDAA